MDKQRSQAALRQCRDEIVRISVPVAISGSVLNALDSGAPNAVELKTLVQSLPCEPLISFGLINSLVQDADQTLLFELLRAADRLRAATALSHDYVLQAFGSQLGVAPVAASWRRAAESFLSLIDQLDRRVENLDQSQLDTQRDTRQWLSEVQMGRWPCIDSLGEIIVPGWPERRLSSRTPEVSIPIEACYGGIWFPAEISDFSEQGLGLRGIGNVSVGAPVYLQFHCSVGVVCIVKWTSGDRFGVEVNAGLRASLLREVAYLMGGGARPVPAGGKENQ